MQGGTVGIVQPVARVKGQQLDFRAVGETRRLIDHEATRLDRSLDGHRGSVPLEGLPNKTPDLRSSRPSVGSSQVGSGSTGIYEMVRRHKSRSAPPEHVCQCLIVLPRTEPLVWRRIQIPEAYSFWDLHVAIQDAMGWKDYHLHEFTVVDARTGRAACHEHRLERLRNVSTNRADSRQRQRTVADSTSDDKRHQLNGL